MKRNLIVFLIGIVLIVVGIMQIVKYNQNYENKEKITGTIYKIDSKTEKYEYTQYDSELHRNGHGTVNYKVYDVYYKYEYNGKEKTGRTQDYKRAWKEGDQITIYYAEETDSAITYRTPCILYYVIFLGMFWCFISILAYLKKYDLKNLIKSAPIPITMIHIMIPIFVSICYWNAYVKHEGNKAFMWLCLVIQMIILGGTICQIFMENKRGV